MPVGVRAHLGWVPPTRCNDRAVGRFYRAPDGSCRASVRGTGESGRSGSAARGPGSSCLRWWGWRGAGQAGGGVRRRNGSLELKGSVGNAQK